ncbi:helix-turn-helix domain-containing protein [Roseateles sp. DAIF2]|uniref:helix-turn-helix domain-containing protein n=1 Tax=Roseateles sp. DAIF2 TaxID=2714952 RepID=UPI001BC9B1BA
MRAKNKHSFKKSTGFSPSQYLTRLRMERARRLLRETERPIVEVGLEVRDASSRRFSARRLACFRVTIEACAEPAENRQQNFDIESKSTSDQANTSRHRGNRGSYETTTPHSVLPADEAEQRFTREPFQQLPVPALTACSGTWVFPQTGFRSPGRINAQPVFTTLIACLRL